MAKSIVQVLIFVFLLSGYGICAELVEKTDLGFINWSHYSLQCTGKSKRTRFRYLQNDSTKATIRLARIKAFKNLYEMVVNLPLQDDKPFKWFLKADQINELIQKTYKGAYVLGWMSIENEIKVSIKFDILKTLSGFMYPYLKKTPLLDMTVFVVDGRGYNIKPSLICKVFNDRKENIYSFYPRYVTTVEEALMYAGPRNVRFLKIKEVKNLRCSFIISSDIKSISDLVVIVSHEEKNKNF